MLPIWFVTLLQKSDLRLVQFVPLVWNLRAVREMSGILLKVREVSGTNIVREKLPKTVYCKLHICIHTGI